MGAVASEWGSRPRILEPEEAALAAVAVARLGRCGALGGAGLLLRSRERLALFLALLGRVSCGAAVDFLFHDFVLRATCLTVIHHAR